MLAIWAATKEQPYSNASQLHIGHRIIGMQAATVLYGFPAGKQLDKFLNTKPFLFKQVFGLGHFNHTQKVALRPCYYADYVFNDLSPLEYSGISKFFSGVITHRFHDTVFL